MLNRRALRQFLATLEPEEYEEEPVGSQWISIAEAAARFSLSDDTVRRMIARGEVEARRFGPRLIRVNADSILASAELLGPL